MEAAAPSEGTIVLVTEGCRISAHDRIANTLSPRLAARKFDFRISEMPVTCVYHAGSSVNRVGDVLNMLGDVIAMRWKHRG